MTQAPAQAEALALADRAESAGRVLPPLLVEAQRIAASVILGEHGRKRAGPGESFWQYRPYSFGDSTQRIDWHKSARAGRVFIRENEWEAANTLWVWAQPGPSMDYKSHLSQTTKRERALLITLAAASLAVRAHERVSALGSPHAPDHSRGTLLRVAQWFLSQQGAALPDTQKTPRFSTALLAGDFFGPLADTTRAITPLAEAGMKGHVVQVVDPAEETLPWSGRVEFQDMAGPARFLATRTESLRDAYRDKLEQHRAGLNDLCRRIGWSFTIHRTDQPPARLLMMLHALMSGEPAR
jgi:uncharacterized protein (DUF58 family)